MIQDDEDFGVEIVSAPKLGKGYRTGPSLADKALERVGETDAWSKSTLRKVAVVSRWRRLLAFLQRMRPSFLRTKSEPKPPFND